MSFISKILSKTNIWQGTLVVDMVACGTKNSHITRDIYNSIEEICEFQEINISLIEFAIKNSNFVSKVYPVEESDKRLYIRSLIRIMLEAEKIGDYDDDDDYSFETKEIYDIEEVKKKTTNIRKIAANMNVSSANGVISFALYHDSQGIFGSLYD